MSPAKRAAVAAELSVPSRKSEKKLGNPDQGRTARAEARVS